MKTHSDELFLLIKALTPKEKLFLKVFSTKNKNNIEYSYLALFDALNEMKQYDEKALRTKLAKQGYKHNLGKAKNYLTKVILKSLAEYHSDTSIDTIIENLIFQSEILYKKRLDKLADKILHKAEKLAMEYEKNEYLLMISSLRSNLALETSDIERLKELMKTEIKKEREYLDHFISEIDYRNLAIEITIFNQSPNITSTDKENSNKLKQLFENPLLKDSKSAFTISAKNYFYQLNYSRFYNRYTSENEKPYEMLEEWVNELEKKRHLLKNLPEVYIKSVSRLIAALGNTGKKDKIENAFKKIQIFYNSLPKKNMNKNVHQSFAHLIINYSYAQMLFFEHEKIVDVFEHLNPSVHTELDITAYFNIFWAYFYTKNYHAALGCINKVINIKSDFRKDLQAEVRLHQLLIHYELTNKDLLPYIAKSSERWRIKNGYPLNDSNKRLVNFFIYKLPKINTPEEEIKEFSILLNDLKKTEGDETVILWLESKIQNRSMLDLAKEQAGKKNKDI